MSSSALALILASVLLAQRAAPPTASYAAALSNEQAQTVAVVTGDRMHRQLKIKLVVAQQIAPDRDLQLWAVPKNGAPRSLGLLLLNGGGSENLTLPLPENATPQLAPLLAISLEPKGGSPNPQGPSGPILFKGPWVDL